jgi:hypothetical protein
VDADEVIDYLVPEADERAVLSAILKKSSEGLKLVAASLVIGPEEMARSSWPTWRHMSGDTISRPDDHHSEFAHDLPNWVVGRTHAPISEARSWLNLAMNGAPPAMGSIPASTASLVPATAPIQVFPKTDSSTCQLVTGTVRPLTGFLFKGSDGEGCESLDWQWEISGQLVPNAPYELLGIFVSGDDHPSPVPTPKGLLVGRLARRAWLIELRGSKDLESFEAHVGIDEGRIHITDLEVE